MRLNRLQTVVTGAGIVLVLLVFKPRWYGHDSLESPQRNGPRILEVSHEDTAYTVQYHSSSSDVALREAIASAIGLPPGTFGLQYRNVAVAISVGSVVDGEMYHVKRLKEMPCAPRNARGNFEGSVEHQVSRGFHDEHGDHGVLDNGVVLSGRKAKLPRVVITCLGTGRYRTLALQALESARTFLGGDCLLSLHLLTDNVTGVESEFNAAYIPYREWPLSGLKKFEDILVSLEKVIKEADYFYFMDGDVRFNEHVLLADVAGDLVAVEHPMYPRHDWGWCVHGKTTMCEYPYERKRQSTAFIPNNYGKFKKTYRNGENTFSANSWYLQSAFWGGKSKFLIPALKEMKEQVDIDVKNKVFSSIIQDERYVNWYFWKHMNDSVLNIRMLGPSYLYPFRDTGFGAWIVNHSRPIIVHGTAKAGKMIIGEAEIKIDPSTGAGGVKEKFGTCFDSFLGDKIGTYSCHDEEYRGGTQGFIWLKNKIRTSETIKLCATGKGLQAGDPVKMGKCIDKSDDQLWDFDNVTKRIMNRASKLCMDPMRFDKVVYPEAFRKNNWPVTLQPCGKSEHQKLIITLIDVESSAKVAEAKKKEGKY